jgi:hypothetical protein
MHSIYRPVLDNVYAATSIVELLLVKWQLLQKEFLQHNISQRKLDTLLKLKSEPQQPTPDKDKGVRDINVSEAISESPSVASASAISKHGPPYIDPADITLSNLSVLYF